MPGKLVLDFQVPSKYDKQTITQLVRAICDQVNFLSEGSVSARYQATTSLPNSTAQQYATSDIIWDSNATVTNGVVRLGWVCTAPGAGPSAKFSEIDCPVITSGTWTPTLTFATPGDLSVSYTTQVGSYVKIGSLVTLQFFIVTSAFTFTTAIGNLQIGTLPFTPENVTGQNFTAATRASGITKVGYTQFTSLISPNSTTMTFRAAGSAVAESIVTAADMPTAGSVILGSVIQYFA